MEELLAFAHLMAAGFELEAMYEEKLNALFMLDPENEDLLELEFLSGNRKESILYIRTHIEYDPHKFGKTFMNLLKPVYENMNDINKFAKRMYYIWQNLDDSLQQEEPFFTLCYADDPLSWGDEKQTRELYENMLSYYDK